METTQIIGNAVGIQYQGITDQSGSATNGLTIGLIVGRFMRGRTDKPMLIDSATIETLLGYEPINPTFALTDSGFEFCLLIEPAS